MFAMILVPENLLYVVSGFLDRRYRTSALFIPSCSDAEVLAIFRE